ncbi:MAG: hypothetical protein GX941_01490 [Candidatus Methanofastidiosa archaeon]|nr:hypothetical protein [Candidatus Methanofastidiosa archaeon]HOM95332.1 hypothetical protein [Methanofastidiosum sp.]HPC80783.1 hypothetical protein [Methanofastidiosum sp.]HRS25081.1 hypothetical protein [Methanofastidiosum sp.]
MKKLISIFLLVTFVLSAIPSSSAQDLPGRSFFIDEKGNPQVLIVLSEKVTAKDIQKVAEVVTKITNETYYSVTGNDEKIIWESPSLVEDDRDNVALGYTGVLSEPRYGLAWRSFTTPAYFYSHGANPTDFCSFKVESVEALFDGDRGTRIVGNHYAKYLLVKFNDYKEISDVNFTFENLPVVAGYNMYYLKSYCPNTLYDPDPSLGMMYGPTGNWTLLPVSGSWPRAGSATKMTDSFSLINPVNTNALLIELDPWHGTPPNTAMPYSLYELEVKGKSFSVLYANTYYIDFAWAEKTLGQEKNMLKRLDYWIEDVKESLPGDFIQTGGKSYSTQTSSYNILSKQINLLRMYEYNEDQTFKDKTVGRIFYGTPLTWADEEFRVGETKTYGKYKVKLVDINWDKSQTTVNFDHKTGRYYLGEHKVTVEITDPQGIVKRHIMTVDCCENVLAELFVDTQAESQAATEALCKLVTTGNNCDIIPIVYHSRMNEAGIDPNYIYNRYFDWDIFAWATVAGDASLHFGSGNHGLGPTYKYVYGYGYDYNAAANYPTLIFNGNKSKAIQKIPPNTEDAYYEAFKNAYEANASRCCDAKVIINTNMDPERFTTAKDREALVTVRLNKDLPNTELYLNVWSIDCSCCAPVATGLITSEYWQNINKWTTDCGEKVTDYNWKDLNNGDVYRTEIDLCGKDYCGIIAFLQDKNTGKIYGSAIRHFTPAPGSNLSPGIASSDCQCVIEYNKDLDCDNYKEEVEFAIEGADVAFVGMEHDLEKNIDGEIKKHMIARFNIYTLTDYGCIDDCDCNYIQNDGSMWKLRFLMNDGNLYNPYTDRCKECTKDLRSIKIELCEPIPFDCLKEGAIFWGPDRYFRVYVEEYDEERYHIKYKIQRVDLIPKKETVNVKVDPANLVRMDNEITASDRVRYNMILIGNKENNEEIKRVYNLWNFIDSEGMIYLKNVYNQKDILILNAANVSDLNEPIKQLSYLLDIIL